MKKQKILKTYLANKFGCGNFPKPKGKIFKDSAYHGEIEKIYQALGGILEEYPTEFNSFDIQCENFIVELDEERHFNRYRLITLNSSIYNITQYFSYAEYKNFCRTKETECLKSARFGNYWKTKSTEIQFGPSDKEGNLEKLGSSRWKQRSFYDFLRDVSSVIMKIPIIRIGVWELVDENTTVNQSLKQNRPELIEHLVLKRASQNKKNRVKLLVESAS